MKNVLETIEAFVSKHPNCILLTHYAVGTYTIDPVPNPLQLTSEKLFQKVKNLPLTVIHGHCHYAPQWMYKEENLTIYNVALPLHRGIVFTERVK